MIDALLHYANIFALSKDVTNDFNIYHFDVRL